MGTIMSIDPSARGDLVHTQNKKARMHDALHEARKDPVSLAKGQRKRLGE